MTDGMRRINPDVVRLIPRTYTDREIVDGMLCGEPAAAAALIDRFGPAVDRRVWRLLGADDEHEDIVQQVFARILESIHKLRDPDALRDWISAITVNSVRKELRRRRYRRIFMVASVEDEHGYAPASQETMMVLRRGFAILDRMKPDERIVFVMRFVEGSELSEIATATGRSLATVKRHIGRARDIFFKKAARDPILASFLEERVDER